MESNDTAANIYSHAMRGAYGPGRLSAQETDLLIIAAHLAKLQALL
jgi:hypothetical protein